MTNSDKYDELVAKAPTLADKARLIREKELMNQMSRRLANEEYKEKESTYGN